MLLGLPGAGTGNGNGVLRDVDADDEIDCATISPIKFPSVLEDEDGERWDVEGGVLRLAAPVTRPCDDGRRALPSNATRMEHRRIVLGAKVIISAGMQGVGWKCRRDRVAVGSRFVDKKASTVLLLLSIERSQLPVVAIVLG